MTGGRFYSVIRIEDGMIVYTGMSTDLVAHHLVDGTTYSQGSTPDQAETHARAKAARQRSFPDISRKSYKPVDTK